VPTFAPFPGLRFDARTHLPADVTAPPYDVLDEDDRAALCARHPHNVVCVDLPRAVAGEDAYAAAAATFASWIADGVLQHDPEAFYVYRMSWTDPDGTRASTIGALGALTLSAPGEGGILPHERTTPKAKSDRLLLLQATRVNLSPIWGLTPAPGFSTLLGVPDPPAVSFEDDAGITHELWLVTEEARVAAIAESVGSAPVVIADGHHRFETSLAYRNERRAAGVDDPGAEATLAWIVALSADELRVGPIHRLLTLEVGIDGVLDALAERFVLTSTPRGDAFVANTAGTGPILVHGDAAWLLDARPGADEGLPDLDSARVDDALLGVEGVGVSYEHDHVKIDRHLADGGVAAVLLRPATVTQILAIAEGGERMPPKTTLFVPKPRTGMVFRQL